MKKRSFLKTSSALVAGSMLAPISACSFQQEQEIRKNWAGNFTYSAENFYQPKTIEEAREIVKSCSKARVLGTRHCFNKIADSKENQISLTNLNQIVSLDGETKKVTIEAGMSYGQLGPILHEKGYALHNLASLPHISVAGACATATHGSGVTNGNLPTAVAGIEFINADGDLIKLSREKDHDKFYGAVVNLGSLGVVTKITLDIQPTFQVQQFVYQNLPVSQLENNFEEIMASGYSVSLFTNWQTGKVNQVWIKEKANNNTQKEPSPEFFGASLATEKLHPIIENDPVNCTEQMGVPGPWYDRLPHFRMKFTPSSGKELQTEYFIPRQYAMGAFFAISKLREQIAPLLMISEIRTIDADNFWMSPCYQNSCVAFHFTWKQDWNALKELLPVIEKELETYEVRPHWGKMFTIAPSRLQSLYKRLPDFKELINEYDPQGKFRNEFIRKYLFSS